MGQEDVSWGTREEHEEDRAKEWREERRGVVMGRGGQGKHEWSLFGGEI